MFIHKFRLHQATDVRKRIHHSKFKRLLSYLILLYLVLVKFVHH